MAEVLVDGGVVRAVTKNDRADITEMARHTYGGHDWIMLEFDNWLESKTSFPFGIEIEGTLKVLEVLRVIDDGETAWLDALRVHPSQRGKGLARRMQQFLVKNALENNPQLKRIRYTTLIHNKASLRLAESVGLNPVFTFSIVMKTASAPEDTTPKNVGDFEQWSNQNLESYSKALQTAIDTPLPATTLATNQQQQQQPQQPLLTPKLSLTHWDSKRTLDGQQDVMDFVMKVHASTNTPVLMLDWKAWQFTRENLQMIIDKGVSITTIEGDGCRGYSLGLTRADFSGEIRVPTMTVVVDDVVRVTHGDAHANELGVLCTLHMMLAETTTAIAQNCGSLMAFYDSIYMETMQRKSLSSNDECVLVERTL
eukprot:m.259394 g.259394  ORF g.259394 m.259394 type:complete len:368 (+) comp37976_c0_seq1:116-1219(+)